MKKTRFFGLWSEHCGNEFPSLLEQPTGVLSELEATRIAAYLENCPVWIASPGIVYSPLADEAIAGSMSIKTDGEWAWQDTMAYYVRRYRISPPIDFIHQIRDKSYVPPPEKDIDVSLLDFPNDF